MPGEVLRRCFSFLAAVGLLSLPPGASLAAEALPRLGVTLAETSVSGLSSGAYMAGQMQVAHSKDIVGAGLVAGGPYACAETASSQLFPYWPVVVWQNATQAANSCMQVRLGAPDAERLAKRAEEFAGNDRIDPLSGLAADKIYLFSGNTDDVVRREVVETAKRFYEAAGVPAGQIAFVESPGGHAFLTEAEGSACGVSKEPYISDCDYDQAKAILEWVYGPLAPPADSPGGQFVVFDQSAFEEGLPNGLAAEGVLYVPRSCAEGPGCRLHIAFHGCDQAREKVGDAFVEKSGFARYADTNRLVILYPQVTASLVNPHGCWDWWGYTGIDYLAKDAPQISAVWTMAQRLAERP
jgi:poly(3-hydroxybutyrate) depolymerase